MTQGTWKLMIGDLTSPSNPHVHSRHHGSLRGFKLVMYGTRASPDVAYAKNIILEKKRK